MKYTFVSDLHGDVNALRALFKKFDSNNKLNRETTLVFLGDYTDGLGAGTDNLGMVEFLTEISYFTDVKFWNDPIFLLGNHDDFILRASKFDTPTVNQTWLANGGRATLEQLGYTGSESIYCFLRANYQDYINWLSELPLSYENDIFYAVHAGLDMNLEDPRKTSDFNKLWLRDMYYTQQNTLGKIIITGHTPTQFLGGDGEVIKLHDKSVIPPRFVIDGGVNSSLIRRHFANLLTIDEHKNITTEKLVY